MIEVSNSLAAAAVSIGVLHTLAGPDHYLPFVAMARAGDWSLTRTIVVTLLCGIGHVLSSVAIGSVGIGLGMGLERMQGIESARGEIAAWALIAFGLIYLLWGIRAAVRNRPHSHLHAHDDVTVHCHDHVHQTDHVHVHESGVKPRSMTPWVFFTIFIFGPCEALIPMLLFPAAGGSAWGVAWVATLFGLATLATMTAVVVVLLRGVAAARLQFLERFNHAAAGSIVLGCGLAVKFGL